MSDRLLLVGIDPSLDDSGVAWSYHDPAGQAPASSTHVPVSHAYYLLERMRVTLDPMTVHVMIEEPETGRGRDERGHTFSMAPVRSAVKLWKGCVRELWPRKNKIETCKPHEWRRVIMGKRPVTGDWKKEACTISGVENHNEADAWCVLKYLVYLKRTCA